MINIQGADLKALSKPLEKLITSVSKGIGEVYKPIGIVREAKAHAQAEIILANAEIEKQEIVYRAAQRLAFLEMRRQQNIDAIADAAAKSLPDSVDEKPVSEDWMVHFFQQSQDIAEPEMQQIWAKILAGEVAKPGSFSRRTLDRMRTLDRSEAELFSKECRVLCKMKDTDYWFRLNVKVVEQFENDLGINGYHFNQLRNVGLLSANELHYQTHKLKDGQFAVNYFDKVFGLYRLENEKPVVRHGRRIVGAGSFSITPLTDVGMELVKIVSREPLPELGIKMMEGLAEYIQWTVRVSPA